MPAQHEDRVRLPTNILPGLGFEITIQVLFATTEAGAVVYLAAMRRSPDGDLVIQRTTRRL